MRCDCLASVQVKHRTSDGFVIAVEDRSGRGRRGTLRAAQNKKSSGGVGGEGDAFGGGGGGGAAEDAADGVTVGASQALAPLKCTDKILKK